MENKYSQEIMDIIGDDIIKFEHYIESAKFFAEDDNHERHLKFALNMYISRKKHIEITRSEMKRDSPELYEKIYEKNLIKLNELQIVFLNFFPNVQ